MSLRQTSGRSAGFAGPVQDYEKNEGTVGQRKIVFIGASYKFVHRVFRDMLLVGGFDDVHVVVHDIDEVPLRTVSGLLEKMARQKETNVTISATLDREEALKGADAAILSITVGGKESDYRSFEVCAKYGIPVGVGDTLGPAALARNLRTVPVVVEIARDMERLCPEVVMLNFTNPMSAITGAFLRHSEIPAFGLCHSGDELYQFFADVFGGLELGKTPGQGGMMANDHGHRPEQEAEADQADEKQNTVPPILRLGGQGLHIGVVGIQQWSQLHSSGFQQRQKECERTFSLARSQLFKGRPAFESALDIHA